MSKRLLFAIAVVLLITNIATLIFWTGDKAAPVTIEDNKTEINPKKAVATIDGEEISFDEWIESLRGTYGKQELKAMIDRKIVDKLAKESDITIDEKVIEREMALLTSMQGVMSAETLKDKEAAWKKDIEYRYQLEALLTEDTDIPEEELKSYYDIYKNQYNMSTTVQVSHIVVDTMETAEQVKQELDDGASFELLAREYSLDEETKDEGGYMGYFVKNSQFLPSGYYEHAAEMEEQTYSEPFQTDGGIAIIYFHRLLPEVTFTYEELKPYIKRELAMDKLNQNLVADPLWDKLEVDWVYEK
ncbi:protein secretion protein [Ornithinibacillus gellani]|uniref:peptidylprolyl isomerase n=1 Tax=Ornithinibacillus gellani TaxID=2293253 RepID=UPI000F484912|nr:peptidylprolyl isomerase [Ornithinibacillus gellani]TQS75320.1 protein secretion protein [Ornithinibacillus gellani]